MDSEGNVGHFRTGEAGAAPVSAVGNQEEDRSLEEIIRAVATHANVEYDVDDLMAMPGGPLFEWSWHRHGYETSSSGTDLANLRDTTPCYCILMQLADPSLVNELKQTAPGIIGRLMGRGAGTFRLDSISNSKYALGYTDGPVPLCTLREWIQNGSVLKAWTNNYLSAARIGMFEFEHGDIFENWIAGLYFRESVPARPLKLDQLPMEVHSQFATRFAKRSFARNPIIDPREAGECISWGDSWVGLDGIVHQSEDLDEEELP